MLEHATPTPPGDSKVEPSRSATRMNAIWKTVRIFISSTFRDMQSERDHLVRFVFPRLGEHLLPYRIHLVDIDLRWGVTSEKDTSDVCREIIDECHPHFLCILGGRYGWIPPGQTHSITADEVRYAVLTRASNNRESAHFYFRDDGATTAMVEAAAGEFREPIGSDSERQLTALKDEITAAGFRPVTYSAGWDNEQRRLTGLSDLGEHVFDDLLASLAADPDLRDRFGGHVTTELDEFAEEDAAMDTFVANRIERFVLGSRETLLAELVDHAGPDGTNEYLCLTSVAGSGKSALLARVYRSLEELARRAEDPSPVVIAHFVGASRGSTDVRQTLRRLCHKLKAASGDIVEDIPEEPGRLAVVFSRFLQHVCGRRRVVILIDAVDQFQTTSDPGGLQWLPQELPANARVILSRISDVGSFDESLGTNRGQDGAVVEAALLRIEARTIALHALIASDKDAIIDQFGTRYRKRFEPAQRAALLAKTDASTPLFLLAALDELRTLGTFDELTKRIEELPHTSSELFDWILDRLANEDGFRDESGTRVARELVSRFCQLLTASRYGLSQRELVNLLDIGDPQGNVAALLHLLRPYLMRRGELLDFYHRQFHAAAARTYLRDEGVRRAAHQMLADYFGAQPLGRRKVEELPWQLERAERWIPLADAFRDLSFLDAAWKANRFEVAGYWAQVERHSHRRLLDTFREWAAVPIHSGNAWQIWNAARLLDESGHGDQALVLWRSLIDYSHRTGDERTLSGALGNAAIRLKDIGDLDTAMTFLEQQERICVARGDSYGLQNAYGNQGLIMAQRGRLDEAMRLHRAKETICRQLGHQLGIAASLGNQALILATREPEAALKLHDQELQICQAIGDRSGAARALRNQALIHEGMARIDRALDLAERSEAACRQAGNKDALARSLMDQARLLQLQSGRQGEAAALLKYEQAEAIYRDIGDRLSLARCLHGASHSHIVLEQPNQALACLDEAQDLFRECGAPHGFEACVLNRAVVLLGWHVESALDLLKEQEARLRASHNQKLLVQCLLIQVRILIEQGALTEAMSRATESEALCSVIGDATRLSRSRHLRASIRDRMTEESI